ncbi:MAG: carboxy terminal-processing peptidase [Alphaproteobacteria bacterium]|nr:carboxy terminal-processing peptidase [Alphaproteobacteria bacterium]
MTRRLVLPVVLSLFAVTAVAAMPDPGPVAKATPKLDASGADGLPSLDVQPYQQEVAGLVAGYLEEVHYQHVQIDDELSSKWLDRYIDELDGARIVFLASDIREFEQYRNQLDDLVMARPLSRLEPAIVIYSRYRQRMLERAADAKAFAAGPVDLTNDETIVYDRKEAGLGWPETAAEARELWRKRVEDDFISGMLTGRDSEDQVRDRLIKRYDRYAKNVSDMETVDVLETYLDAMTQSADPHSVWFKPTSKDDFDVDITNSVEGIGAQLTTDDGYVVIDRVIPGGPADMSGRVRAKDRILEVAQKSEAPVEVVEMRLDRVVKMIRGPKGTQVNLTIEHADGEREVVAIQRDRVTLERSAAEGHVEEVDGHKLGILRLSNFYVDYQGARRGRSASNDLSNQLEAVKAQGAEGVVLDLRGNGGGSLMEAIEVAGLFLPGGPVVQVRDRKGAIEALHDEDPRVVWDGPLTVMVDSTSASASEIVAAALQDYGRALVVGDHTTHGKGTVQQVVPLTPALKGRHAPDDDEGGALKITIQKFYRVSGGSTQNLGVTSDVELPSVWDGVDFIHESDLPNALAWDRIPPAPYAKTSDLASAVPKLQEKSAARVAADPDYERLAKQLARREEDKARTAVSLVLEQRKADYEARKALLDAESGEEDVDFSAMSDEERKAYQRAHDYGLDEGLHVLADLVEALG